MQRYKSSGTLIDRIPNFIARLRASGAARDFGWLAVDRGIRMVFAVVVGLWVARYLGPEAFGRLNYALAVVAMLEFG